MWVVHTIPCCVGSDLLLSLSRLSFPWYSKISQAVGAGGQLRPLASLPAASAALAHSLSRSLSVLRPPARLPVDKLALSRRRSVGAGPGRALRTGSLGEDKPWGCAFAWIPALTAHKPVAGARGAGRGAWFLTLTHHLWAWEKASVLYLFHGSILEPHPRSSWQTSQPGEC